MSRGLVIIAMVLTLAGCTAHFPVNLPLEQHDPDGGYRLLSKSVPDNSEELFLLLTFSGGGTRAAAFAYGVLEELARTEVVIDGRRRRLLDEVDVISSVSGGSFTAAYYGLFGDRIFEDFEDRFLKRNVDKALTLQLFVPANWARLVSAGFSRSDLAARYFDKHVFEGSTFADIAARGGPGILINATDMTLGAQFGFSQDQFDWLCSDLSRFTIARAVAASSAVPVLFTPVTLRNYAGGCGYRPPQWFVEALNSPETSTRRYEHAEQLSSYLDVMVRPYVHLLDGGLSDNLGLRPALTQALLAGGAWSALREGGLERTRKFVFMVVNAESDPDVRRDQQKRAPKIKHVLDSTTSFIINKNNFATLEALRKNVSTWQDDVRIHRCATQNQVSTVSVTQPEKKACDDFEFAVVEVSFDTLTDKSERGYLQRLPTSFNLSAEAVDRLRSAAARILAESQAYQELLKDFR